MTLRQDKADQLIQQKLAKIILKEIEFPSQSLITITRTKTSPDLKLSRIYISVLPDNQRGTALEILRRNKIRLHQLLKKELTTKFTPNLQFIIDEQPIYASEIDKLLDEIK
jgi:ribosome-binding factor A